MNLFFSISIPIFFWFFLVISLFQILLIFVSIPLIKRRFKEMEFERIEDLLSSETIPRIAIVIPFHNGEELAVNSVTNSLNIDYPNLQVVAVNDQSEDRTFEMFKEAFALQKALPRGKGKIKTEQIKGVYRSRLYPNLIVIDKVSLFCKGDAINAGLNETSADLVAIVDDDTILEKDCLLRMIRPFYNKESITAQGGTLRILNGCTLKNGAITKIAIPNQLWPGIQVVEYLRAFLYGRLGWNALGGSLIISGAFGLFRRDRLIEFGGFDPSSMGEDFELTARIQMKMRDQGFKDIIQFIPDPVAWTAAPDTVKTLKKQRIRWHQGLIEVLLRYRKMFFNPKYGKAGLIGYPYMLLGEFIEPILEVFGIVLVTAGVFLGYISVSGFITLFLLTWGITLALTSLSIFLEITIFRRYTKLAQIFKLLLYSLLENIALRPLYLIWRFSAIYNFFAKKRSW